MATRRPTRSKSPVKAAAKKQGKAKLPRAPSPAKKKAPSRAKPSRAAGDQATSKRLARAELAAPTPMESGRALPIEIDPRRIEESFAKVTDELRHWANKGRYTRVRFKFRGKPLLPDLPLAAVVAAEGLTFYWGGILRALIVNLAGKTVFDVELVNDADKKVQEGKEALLRGDLDAALIHLRDAIAMDRDHAPAHLQLGVALKLSGDRVGARDALAKAKKLDPKGAVGGEAEKLLASLGVVNGLVLAITPEHDA